MKLFPRVLANVIAEGAESGIQPQEKGKETLLVHRFRFIFFIKVDLKMKDMH